MKDDYLWEKTGSDPAIEKLENALRALSYEESALPTPVIIAAPAKTAGWFRFTPLVFAAAASLAVAAISWGGWFDRVQPAPMEFEVVALVDIPQTPAPSAVMETPVESALPAPQRASLLVEKVSFRTKVVKPVARAVKPVHAVAAAPKFTKAEIAAYNQLMLALSITSNSLGQVRDKTLGE